MKSILLLTHDTSLSGAPKSILLIFEQLIKKNYSITTIALKGGGKLEHRFRQISTRYYRLDEKSTFTSYTVSNRLKKKLLFIPILSDYEKCLQEISTTKFDLIYCNTIVCLTLGQVFKEKIRCKFILHVHELATVIEEFCPSLSKYDDKVDLYIVPSELNKKCLLEKYHISQNKIQIIRETTDVNEKNKIKKNSPFIRVLMCGGAYWRKGDDLFVLIAHAILKKDNRFRFYWVGHLSVERRRVNLADIEKLGLTDFVFFEEETENPLKSYLQSDIFLLPSREDPFPLAAIEAGMLGLPIFCFDEATGIAEVIDSTCVVPYLDIEEMAKRIVSLSLDPIYFEKLSEENKLRFSKFTPEVISTEINNLFQTL